MNAIAASIHSLADLRARRILVLGLGRSGIAAARAMSAAGAVVTAYDRRPLAELDDAAAALAHRGVTLAAGVAPPRLEALLAEAELLITSPSISPDSPTTDAWLREALTRARHGGAEIVSEVDLFLRLTPARVLAITGTKGKTTTTAMIGSILAAAAVRHLVGGNIGQPLIEEVESLGPADWAVLELSELQLPTISRGAEIAVYTNIGADHLDRHVSQEAYRAVKTRLAELTVRSGRVVLNADDPGCRELGARLPAAAIAWYALDAEQPGLSGRLGEGWLMVDGERVLAIDELPLPGRHLLADALAAALAAHLAGVAPAMIAAGLRGFRGVAHRLELIGEWRRVRWVNDSQATIPVAAVAALRAFEPAGVVLIAGGKDKGLDYGELADEIAAHCAHVVLIGETAGELERLLAGRVTAHRAGSMEEAVRLAARLAHPGEVVLLAPAAASFDMFDDYAARGEAFRSAALALAALPQEHD